MGCCLGVKVWPGRIVDLGRVERWIEVYCEGIFTLLFYFLFLLAGGRGEGQMVWRLGGGCAFVVDDDDDGDGDGYGKGPGLVKYFSIVPLFYRLHGLRYLLCSSGVATSRRAAVGFCR